MKMDKARILISDLREAIAPLPVELSGALTDAQDSAITSEVAAPYTLAELLSAISWRSELAESFVSSVVNAAANQAVIKTVLLMIEHFPALAPVEHSEGDTTDAAVDEVKNELPTAVLAYLRAVADQMDVRWRVIKMDKSGRIYAYYHDPIMVIGEWKEDSGGIRIGFIPKSYGIDWKTWEIRRKAAVEADTRHLETEWVVGVDKWGEVFIINAPDIAPHFLEYRTAEEIGIEPYQWPGTSAGVYLIKCEYEENHDPETGMVDDYRFRIVSIVKKDD